MLHVVYDFPDADEDASWHLLPLSAILEFVKADFAQAFYSILYQPSMLISTDVVVMMLLLLLKLYIQAMHARLLHSSRSTVATCQPI